MNPRLIANREKRKQVIIEVPLACEQCEQFVNNNCQEHNADVEEINIVIRPITWMRQHEIRATSYELNAQTQTVQFSMSSYVSNCLEEMVVDAPWGLTNGIFLATVTPEFGSALETLVPPLGGIDAEEQNKAIEQIKKAQN